MKNKTTKIPRLFGMFPHNFFLQTAQHFLCFYLPFVRFFKQKHLAYEASLPSRLNRDRYRNGVHDSTCMHVCTSNSQLAGQKCIEFVLVWYIYTVWWYVTKELGGSEGEAVKMLVCAFGELLFPQTMTASSIEFLCHCSVVTLTPHYCIYLPTHSHSLPL